VRHALPSRFEQRHPVEKIRKLAAVLDTGSPDGVYRRLTEQWPFDPSRAPSAERASRAADDCVVAARLPDFVDRMMYYDLVGYLPGDVLTKVDRASMWASLEVRVPLLDHRLVDWAWTLPASLKLRAGVGKWLLREALYRHVPRELIERPKTGFGVPVGDWLKGELRPWAEELLTRGRLDREGFLKPEPIRQLWQSHVAGRRDNSSQLWTVLMFQAWLERWGG
jgi:asparagine synthase (glutamine-hydrolysing)